MATFTISTELVVTLKYYYEKNISVVRRHHFDFLLIGIHSMQGWTASTRHGVTRKEAQKDYRVQKICLERTYS